MLLSVRKLGTTALATTMTRPQCPARKAGMLAHAVCQAENRNDYKRFDPRRLPIHRQPGNPFQGDHDAYFYQKSDSVLQALYDFIGGALGGGNAAIIIGTKMHRKGPQRRLIARGLDIPKASKEGRYVELDASELVSKIMVEGGCPTMTEERFRLLVDAVQDYAIFMLDVQGHIISWNKGAERIKGYGVSEIIGKHFSIFYPEEDLQSGKPQRELEIAARDGRLEDEGWRLRKDGSRFWASVIITAIRNEAGKLVGFGKVTRDYTEKIKANEALRKEIVERAEAQRKLHDSEKSLRQLSLRLLQTQDEERRRIGRDLHDSVGQYLVGLKMKVDSLKSSRERGRQDDVSQLTECSQLIEEALKEVRTISYLLYPPMLEELGLKSAIPWYLDGFTKRSGIKTAFEVSPEFERIPGDLELALFRVLQESLTNVHRHSGSSTATIRLLTENRCVVLQVSDEGNRTESKNWEDRGQDLMGALGVGLRGMNERMRQLGGNLELSSVQGGTTVTATLPIPEVEPA
jgi:PAS domain S-box-containing protein